MGINVTNLECIIGRKLRNLWIRKHGLDANAQPPKRTVMINGRPTQVNIYYAQDRDIMEEAIRFTYERYQQRAAAKQRQRRHQQRKHTLCERQQRLPYTPVKLRSVQEL